MERERMEGGEGEREEEGREGRRKGWENEEGGEDKDRSL